MLYRLKGHDYLIMQKLSHALLESTFSQALWNLTAFTRTHPRTQLYPSISMYQVELALASTTKPMLSSAHTNTHLCKFMLVYNLCISFYYNTAIFKERLSVIYCAHCVVITAGREGQCSDSHFHC